MPVRSEDLGTASATLASPERSAALSPARRSRVGALWRDHHADIVSVLVIVLLSCAFFSPALVDGLSFGGFDIAAGRLSALGAGLYPSIHSFHDADAVSQMISWNTLDWRLVHEGQLPLWNSYSVLGMPELANFESSVFSLPDLVSYLVPIREAFLVAVITKLEIAGTGTYLFARLLGARPIAALFAGVTFMLSGPFVNWVTWPLSDVYAWAGWLCGLAILVYRAPRRPLRVALLGLAVAFSIYGGFPESNILLALGLGFGVVVLGVLLLLARRHISLEGLAAVGASGLLGAMLAAPLLLPGLQVIAGSYRASNQAFVGLPLRTTSLLLTQGYFGMPIGSDTSFSLTKWNYYETVAYVGVIAAILVVVALARGFRRPIVVALGCALVFTLAVSYQPHELPSLQEVLDHVSTLRLTRLSRERTTSMLIVAVLAGLGLESLLSHPLQRSSRNAMLAGTVLVATAVGYLCVDSAVAHLAGNPATARFDSLIWPVAMVVVAIFVTAAMFGARRLSSRANPRAEHLAARAPVLLALVLLGAQTSELFFAGVGIPTYSKGFYPATPAELTLERAVGTGLVGLDTGKPLVLQRSAAVGFYPNVNIGYNIRLFAVHDPLVPSAYFTSWPGPAPKPSGGPALFVPDVDTAAIARHYGIGYILAAPGLPPPPGTEQITTLDGEALYRVPGAAQFAFAAPSAGRVLASSSPSDGVYEIRVTARRRALLILRVTDVPGWNLTIDGRPGSLRRYDSVMESAEIPAGTHQLRLSYWPGRFSDGVDLALVALALLVLACCAAPVRAGVMAVLGRAVLRGRRGPDGAGPPPGS